MITKEELKLSRKDRNKLKSKILGKGVFTFVFLLLSAFSIFYFFKISADNYLVLFIISIIFFGTFTHIIYLIITLKKDLNSNIKIVTKVRILKKQKKTKDGISDYYISLSGDYNYNRYEVRKKDFEQIKNGDTVALDYTKYGNWVLKIKCNEINIENNANFK